MDVDTFNVRLATLSYLDKADVLAYQQRAKDGEDINRLIQEATKVNDNRRNRLISKKIIEFLGLIKDLGLSNTDQSSLTKLIDDKTDLKKLQIRAQKIQNTRVRQDTSRRQQQLYQFLSRLNIDQTDRNAIINRFEKGENETTLRQNALQIQKRQAATKVSK